MRFPAAILACTLIMACTSQQAAQTQRTVTSQTEKSVSEMNRAIKNAHVNDAQLKVRVTAAIAAQAGVNVFHVSTTVKDGVVELTGSVPSKQIEQTVIAASHVAGVKRVVSRLTASAQ